jgi:hypothetical protein
MKINITIVSALFSLATWPLHADEPMKMSMDTPTPPASWATLEKQAKDLASAVQAQDVHPIHKIDHAIAEETAALKKSEPALPADQKAKLDGFLDDMAKQTHRAHMDGHAANWPDAAAAQKQFVADLKEAEAILPSAK